jgi:hypothetical protein
MFVSEDRPNWLSQIIEANLIASDLPIPWQRRIAERDAVVEAIRTHPDGQQLATLADLPDVVWGAMGAAHHRQSEIERNPHIAMSSPALYASQVIFSAARWRSDERS